MAIATAPRSRILVVEDEPDLRAMIGRALGTLGDVTCAIDGQDALDRIAAGLSPDLVVSDVMMPHIDGLELSRRLKSNARLRGVAVVLLTARAAPRDIVAGINAGARHYLMKPFKPSDLVATAKRALGR